MSQAYANEKFTNAIITLATSPGGIHERLIDAFVYHLGHIQVERDMPEGLREDFGSLMARLTKENAAHPDEGRLQATVRGMSTEEAVEAAKEIVALAYQVKRYSGDEGNGV